MSEPVTCPKPSSNMLSAGVLGFMIKNRDLYYMDRDKGETRQRIVRLKPDEFNKLVPQLKPLTERDMFKLRGAVLVLIKYLRVFEHNRIK